MLGDVENLRPRPPYEERDGVEQHERDQADQPLVHPRRLPFAAAGKRSGQETMRSS
jgi:hypothetical protein